jgi:DNA-binding NarL/FixJ family response regulator
VGGALALEQAVAAAEAELSGWARAVAAGEPGAVATPFSLTPRELDVLRLLAAGRSDREIGEALFISHRTVHRHVAGVYAKLGVSTRAAAGRVAQGAGLLGDAPMTLK